MLQPYSIRSKIRTLIAEYKDLGTHRRDTIQKIRQNHILYMIGYDHVGKEAWDGGEWKTDEGLRSLARRLKELNDQEAILRERGRDIEQDALRCYMKITSLCTHLQQQCQGTKREMLDQCKEGFSFEVGGPISEA